jgi:hypothetical protein
MIGVCAGYFRPKFFLRETIIPRESNSHARRQVYIPHMGSELQTSCKVDLTRSRKGEKTQTENIRQSSGMIQLNKLPQMFQKSRLKLFGKILAPELICFWEPRWPTASPVRPVFRNWPVPGH